MQSSGQGLKITGEYDKFNILLRRRLHESGWCDQVRLQAREIVKERGPNITVDQLLEDLLPQGRAAVPSAIKKELLLKVKDGLMRAAGIENEDNFENSIARD